MVTSFIWGLTVITLFRRMKDYCSVTATHFSCSAALIHTSVVKNCQIPLNTEHMQVGSVCCLLLKTTDTSIYLSSTLISCWCSLHWRMNNVLKNHSIMKQIIWSWKLLWCHQIYLLEQKENGAFWSLLLLMCYSGWCRCRCLLSLEDIYWPFCL